MGQPSQAAVSRYDIGDLATLRATFVSTDGVTPADPSYVAFLVKDPFGTVATYVYGAAGASVVRAGAGGYLKDVTVTAAGSWFYRAVGTGGVQAADEWSFISDPSFLF